MKAFRLICLLCTGLMFSSCLTTLLTVATASQRPATTTVVTTPQPVVYSTPVSTTTTIRNNYSRPTSTTVKVNAMTTDISMHLDLQAVAAAFAQSSSVEEFEMILNSSRYMISNLDINRDGFVDYLRVMEVVNSYNHVFVIQAVLAYNVYQNVATLTVEMGYNTPYCQVIGDPYIYGERYIVEPVFIKTPPMFSVFSRPGYVVWSSPYYWGYFPSYYVKPAPQYLSHYQAYVNTYIHNHKYCHQVTYPTVIHYTNYITVIQPVSRNDYQQAHPEEGFSTRTSSMTYTPEGSTQSRSVRNANDVRQAVAATSVTTSSTSSRSAQHAQQSNTSTSSSSSRSSASTSSSASSPSRTSSSSTTTAQPTRTSTTTTKTTTTTSRSSASESVQPSRTTSTSSRVNTEGRVRTTSTTRTTVPTEARRASSTDTSRSASTSTNESRNTGSTSRSSSR